MPGQDVPQQAGVFISSVIYHRLQGETHMTTDTAKT